MVWEAVLNLRTASGVGSPESKYETRPCREAHLEAAMDV